MPKQPTASELKQWYHNHQIERVLKSLELNGFTALAFEKGVEARDWILSQLNSVVTIGVGGSMTLEQIGLTQALMEGNYRFLNQYAPGISREENLQLRRKSLLSDIYITSTNAVTKSGQLVNIDGRGNRVAALCFGPKKVFIVVGVNKLVPDLDSAIDRIKNYAAPMNAKRLNCETPCAKDGRCHECQVPGRICNMTLIIDKDRNKRITVVLVNETLGL